MDGVNEEMTYVSIFVMQCAFEFADLLWGYFNWCCEGAGDARPQCHWLQREGYSRGTPPPLNRHLNASMSGAPRYTSSARTAVPRAGKHPSSYQTPLVSAA